MAELNLAQKKYLLGLAREAVSTYLQKGEHIKPETEDKALWEKRGAFVTIKVKGELRGCIGHPLPYKPLVETIVDVAIAAATQDFRFPPLHVKELPDVNFEISVLSLPRPVGKAEEVQVGRHGIIISRGASRGLLLPQVPVEHDWDLETYLRHGCLKAGLEPDAWKRGAKIEVFTAEVFNEQELGLVREKA